MKELAGTKEIHDKEKVLKRLSDKRTLLLCTPGVKQVNGDKFTALVKVGPLNVEVEGVLKDFSVSDNEVSNTMEVTGPGIIVVISTFIKVHDNLLEWKASYDVTGPLAKAISNTIDQKAREIAAQIVECTLSSAHVSDNA